MSTLSYSFGPRCAAVYPSIPQWFPVAVRDYIGSLAVLERRQIYPLLTGDLFFCPLCGDFERALAIKINSVNVYKCPSIWIPAARRLPPLFSLAVQSWFSISLALAVSGICAGEYEKGNKTEFMVSQKDSTTTSYGEGDRTWRQSDGGLCQSVTAASISILYEPPVKANHERSRNNCRGCVSI